MPVAVLVEFARSDQTISGFRVGFRTRNDDALLDRAVEAAGSAELAIVMVGTTAEWESEGIDRPTFELPARQVELIERVASVNERTVVVVNAGAPVDMSWVGKVAAALQCWFGGQEMATALAGVLFGELEPGGRLPTTIPMHLEHTPSHDNFPGENGEVRYGEGLFMGYRGFDHHRIDATLALVTASATRRSRWAIRCCPPQRSPPMRVSLSLSRSPIRETGPDRKFFSAMSRPTRRGLRRPPKELKAFSKVWLEPGESTTVEFSLDSRSFAYWDSGQPDWERIQRRQNDMFGGSPTQERRHAGWQVEPRPL